MIVILARRHTTNVLYAEEGFNKVIPRTCQCLTGLQSFSGSTTSLIQRTNKRPRALFEKESRKEDDPKPEERILLSQIAGKKSLSHQLPRQPTTEAMIKE
jgi:hypothetical protein